MANNVFTLLKATLNTLNTLNTLHNPVEGEGLEKREHEQRTEEHEFWCTNRESWVTNQGFTSLAT